MEKGTKTGHLTSIIFGPLAPPFSQGSTVTHRAAGPRRRGPGVHRHTSKESAPTPEAGTVSAKGRLGDF